MCHEEELAVFGQVTERECLLLCRAVLIRCWLRVRVCADSKPFHVEKKMPNITLCASMRDKNSCK